jgi:L-aminopeptidase/D-esterase-like protein
VVNAVGVILDRAGRVVRGNCDPQTGVREHPLEGLTRRLAEAAPAEQPHAGNTTLTVVVTNQKLDRRELTQLGRQVHSSMARAIYPFHTLMDGDVLYAVTTNEVEHPALRVAGLGMLASEVVWDAILSI